jgi:hypothetical protein
VVSVVPTGIPVVAFWIRFDDWLVVMIGVMMIPRKRKRKSTPVMMMTTTTVVVIGPMIRMIDTLQFVGSILHNYHDIVPSSSSLLRLVWL